MPRKTRPCCAPSDHPPLGQTKFPMGQGPMGHHLLGARASDPPGQYSGAEHVIRNRPCGINAILIKLMY